MENDILDSLNDLGYQGPLSDEVAFAKALEGGPKSLEFTKLIHILAEELKKLCHLEEAVSIMNSPDESSSFLLELSSFLKELGCPYKCLIIGHMSSRLQSKEDRLLLLDYMISELMAARMVQVDCPKEKQSAGMEIVMQESPTAKDLKDILIALKFNKPPPNITPEMLFSKLEAKLKETLQKEGEQLVGKPLYNKALSEKEWKNLETAYSEMFEEYRLRRETLITRLECTIQSFEWSDRLKTKKDAIQSVYRPKREALKVKPDVKLSDFLAARSSLLHVEKTSSASVRKNTQSDVNKVIMGQNMKPKRSEAEKKRKSVLRKSVQNSKELNDGQNSLNISEGTVNNATTSTQQQSMPKSPKSTMKESKTKLTKSTMTEPKIESNVTIQHNPKVYSEKGHISNQFNHQKEFNINIKSADHKPSKKVEKILEKKISHLIENYRKIPQMASDQLHFLLKKESKQAEDCNLDKSTQTESVNQLNDPDDDYRLRRKLEIQSQEEMSELIYKQHLEGIIELPGKKPRSMQMAHYEKPEENIHPNLYNEPMTSKENNSKACAKYEIKTQEIETEIVKLVDAKAIPHSNIASLYLKTPNAKENLQNSRKKSKKSRKNDPKHYEDSTELQANAKESKQKFDPTDNTLHVVILERNGKHFSLYTYMIVHITMDIALERYQQNPNNAESSRMVS